MHERCVSCAQAKLAAAEAAAIAAQHAAQEKLSAEQQAKATLEAELQVHCSRLVTLLLLTRDGVNAM
jgi:hypothetical protein